MARRRRVLLPYHYSSNKKLVQIVVRLRDAPGALAGILSLLTSKVDLIGTNSYAIENDAAMFTCFAQTLRKSDSAQSIQAAVSMSPWVLEAQVWESKNGLLVDSYHTGLQLGTGEPYIMMPSAGVSTAFQTLVDVFGTGGDTIIYNLGLSFGADRFKAYKQILGPDPKTRVGEAAHIFEALGYGSSEITSNESDGSYRLVVTDCFECTTPSKNGRSCSFRRGLATGAFSALLGRKVRCEETKCRQRGDSACEFDIRPATG